jgi:hypothetical protein
MELYYVTTPERAAAIMQHGFQDTEVEEMCIGEGVTLYDVRPGPDGGALRKSRRVEVRPEGVEVTAGPTLLIGWRPPERFRWLRVRLDLPDETVAAYKLVITEMPQGLSAEERDQYLRDLTAGRIPAGEGVDWGYGEYVVPLEVLQVHARLEGPFTCDAETDDPVLESTVEPGMDFHIEVDEVDPEEEDEEPPAR